ncbi:MULTISPECIES: DUF5719 family protein [Bifidobacterium]|uniref:DUF5719 family protein n=1 Tax=Bifidobacterium TaxID=1678 RepID=UPI001BDCAFBF|nr:MULTISPECIES: DUF5719 family protein [Bifidobacterium]MBT1162420.1 hypothetical protein [Bifidobacterium sp. SO1]MBW3078313.1 hypothetical protein [Bifidobacterium simiiventris]
MSGQAPRHRAARTGLTIAAATTSALIVISLFAASVVLRPFSGIVDDTAGFGSQSSQQVSQLQLSSYCPARMSLADTGEFGDSQFRISSGNIASSARYAAFGSVYQSSVGSLAATGDTTSLVSDGQSDVLTTSGDVDQAATVLRTRLLESKSGTGTASSVASWATTGDLKGISAASCVGMSLSHQFLLSGTATGTTQQLVIANPSSKATAVQVEAWGTSGAGKLTLSTGESVTVRANGETTIDLSAAVPGQNGLYVSVSSRQSPIAAVVRTVSMDGLTSHGSEYVTPLADASATSVMPSVTEGDHVDLIAFGRTDSAVRLSWVTSKGLVSVSDERLTAGTVAVIDAGRAPKDAMALVAVADKAIYASARIVRNGENGQEDFAMENASAAYESSAVAIPDGFEDEATFVNVGSADAKAVVKAYDSHGTLIGQEELALDANTAKRLDIMQTFPDAVAVRVDRSSGELHWGVSLSRNALDDASLAGVAYLPSTPLDELRETIRVDQDPSIVR